jgi:hypothetical protein
VNKALYGRYCRAWRAYLEHVGRAGRRDPAALAFLARLHGHVRPGYRVLRWPRVWPEIEYLFGTAEKFTGAVGAALAEVRAG